MVVAEIGAVMMDVVVPALFPVECAGGTHQTAGETPVAHRGGTFPFLATFPLLFLFLFPFLVSFLFSVPFPHREHLLFPFPSPFPSPLPSPLSLLPSPLQAQPPSLSRSPHAKS